jgi:predicted amidohydrolase YtcJ
LALVNGNILTLDAKNTIAGSIAITDGRIAAITPHGGNDASQVIDLKGATVIPGLNDSHIHFIRLGIDPGYGVRDIEVAQSINELQQIIAGRATTVPAQAFITCIGGWNRAGLKENRLPTQAELDAAAPRNPVYLAESGGGGAGITNTAAAAFFKASGVPVNADGTVSNTTNAKNALVAVQTDADRLRSTTEAVDHATGLGLTMIQDMGGLIGLGSYAYSLQLWAEKKLNIRIRYFNWSGDDAGITEMETRIANQLKQLGDSRYYAIGVGGARSQLDDRSDQHPGLSVCGAERVDPDATLADARGDRVSHRRIPTSRPVRSHRQVALVAVPRRPDHGRPNRPSQGNGYRVEHPRLRLHSGSRSKLRAAVPEPGRVWNPTRRGH